MVGKLFTSIIKIYQHTLSPDHGWFKRFYPGGYCRFQPTCSDYSILAIEKHGAIIGSGKSLYRILRCNPWNRGGLNLP